MREPIPETFTLYNSLPEADIFYDQNKGVALVLCKANFLPMEIFQDIFRKVTELANNQTISTILFDKRSLTIFHQPSMEWYYLEWKNDMMKQHGLKDHIKLLPKDDLFRQSVKKARGKILSENPEHPINHINILYFENLKEVMKHLLR